MLILSRQVEISVTPCYNRGTPCNVSDIFGASPDFESIVPPDPSIFKLFADGFYMVVNGDVLLEPVSFRYTKPGGGQCELHLAYWQYNCAN